MQGLRQKSQRRTQSLCAGHSQKMSQNAPTPYLKAWIAPDYIGTQEPVECYVFMVTALNNRPLLFTVHTEHGAVYSRLPVDALTPRPGTRPVSEVVEGQPWSTVGTDIECFQVPYLKDYTVKDLNTGELGTYCFSIDAVGGAFSEDPEQHKLMHLCSFELTNTFRILPNNMLGFIDEHFATKPPVRYARNTRYWYAKS
jgi:hypothetical protein